MVMLHFLFCSLIAFSAKQGTVEFAISESTSEFKLEKKSEKKSIIKNELSPGCLRASEGTPRM